MNESLTFREQMEGMVSDNMAKYPDAVKWLVGKLAEVDLDNMPTDLERCFDILQNAGDFKDHPYKKELRNFDTLLAWYRRKNPKISLSIAIKRCREFIEVDLK